MVADRHRYAVLGVTAGGARGIYFCRGFLQGCRRDMEQPDRSRHVARHLAHGCDHVVHCAVQPDFWHTSGVVGGTFYLSRTLVVADPDRYPVSGIASGGGADLSAVLRQQRPARRLAEYA